MMATDFYFETLRHRAHREKKYNEKPKTTASLSPPSHFRLKQLNEG